MYCRAALAALVLAAVSCSHSDSANSPRHLAVLRFENLSTDASLDWIGRAFSEIVSRELAGAPGLYAIPPGRVHALDTAFGRPAGNVPGVSSERAEALAAGADRLGYGEYSLREGMVEARLTLEDVRSGKTEVISAAAGDALSAADALARQISSQATAYSTRSTAAIRAFVLGVQARDPEEAAQHFRESIAADPNFEPPYDGLAQQRLRQRDTAGALALLDEALAQRDRMPPLEHAQLAFDAANVRGDTAAKRQALADWTRAAPSDPVAWSFRGETAMNVHEYTQAVDAYQRALALQPNDAALLNQLGYASAYAGDLAAGMRALQQYASVRAADANPLDSMGDVNLLFGRWREAETFYLQAAKKDPAFLGGGDLRKAAMARLMSGDVRGAGALYEQYVGRRVAQRDPLADYYRAEWLWTSGSRPEGYQRLEEFAQRVENSPLKEAAAEAYAELAVWSVALGKREEAARLAQKAGMLAGPASAGTVAVTQFLAQPAASAAEWSARADRAFPQAAEKPLRDRALLYALLADRQFRPAMEILKPLYENGGLAANEQASLLLAWCYVETGRAREAAELLRFTPLPASSGVQPFQVFYFPRVFYLRGRAAGLGGQADAARAQYGLFLQLSGAAPLIWGEEARAR